MPDFNYTKVNVIDKYKHAVDDIEARHNTKGQPGSITLHFDVDGRIRKIEKVTVT